MGKHVYYDEYVYVELYRFEHDGKLIRVALFGGNPAIMINDLDTGEGVSADIPRDQIAPFGRALVEAWEGSS